ncbi:MAG: hypothetical protein LQ340_002922 [Diploschistes diacapsis]|nr:MAG: hypothetical protein LQ340_002922 [Diploschistes diacapsis]
MAADNTREREPSSYRSDRFLVPSVPSTQCLSQADSSELNNSPEAYYGATFHDHRPKGKARDPLWASPRAEQPMQDAVIDHSITGKARRLLGTVTARYPTSQAGSSRLVPGPQPSNQFLREQLPGVVLPPLAFPPSLQSKDFTEPGPEINAKGKQRAETQEAVDNRDPSFLRRPGRLSFSNRRSSQSFEMDADSPAVAALHRSKTAPVHGAQARTALPAVPSQRYHRLKEREPPEHAPCFLCNDVCEGITEQEVAQACHLGKTNSEAPELPSEHSETKIGARSDKPKRMRTKKAWQSIHYGPAALRETYQTSATSDSNSGGASREPSLAPGRKVPKLLGLDRIGALPSLQPAYLQHTGPTTARWALEETATKKFDKDKSDNQELTSQRLQVPGLGHNVHDFAHARAETPTYRLPREPPAPLPPPKSALVVDAQPAPTTATTIPSRHGPSSDAWSKYGAYLQVLPEFAYRFDEDDEEQSSVGAGRDQRDSGSSWGDLEKDGRVEQLERGGRVWKQAVSAVLVAFNVM